MNLMPEYFSLEIVGESDSYTRKDLSDSGVIPAFMAVCDWQLLPPALVPQWPSPSSGAPGAVLAGFSTKWVYVSLCTPLHPCRHRCLAENALSKPLCQLEFHIFL